MTANASIREEVAHHTHILKRKRFGILRDLLQTHRCCMNAFTLSIELNIKDKCLAQPITYGYEGEICEVELFLLALESFGGNVDMSIYLQ